MKKYPHKNFLEKNQEVLHKLPVPGPLNQRLIGFDELLEDLEHTVGEEREQLEEKLDDLSHEIDEDLEEYYAPVLENNDEEYEEQFQVEIKPDFEKPCGCSQKHNDTPIEATVHNENDDAAQYEIAPEANFRFHNDTVEEPVEVTEERSESEHPEKNTAPGEPERAVAILREKHNDMSDEEILDHLVALKLDSVHISVLLMYGFKTPLGARQIILGPYRLDRSRYSNCYTIKLA